jgi:hypothetical protein
MNFIAGNTLPHKLTHDAYNIIIHIYHDIKQFQSLLVSESKPFGCKLLQNLLIHSCLLSETIDKERMDAVTLKSLLVI